MASIEPAVIGVAQAVEFADVDHDPDLGPSRRPSSVSDVTVGWVYERPDGGRAFGTTLGHPYKNFQIESFRRMIVNGILWSAHVDVPRAGAPVNVGEQFLKLPPKE